MKLTDHVLQAAKELFILHGYEKVAMDDIAKAAQKSRSSIYNHFKNKREIFDHIAKLEFEKSLDEAIIATSEAYTLADNLYYFYLEKIRSVKEIALIYKSIVNEVRVNNDLFVHLKNLDSQREFAIIQSFIQNAIDKREILKQEKEDLDFLTDLIINSLRNMQLEMILYKEINNLEKKLHWLTTLLTKGLK